LIVGFQVRWIAVALIPVLLGATWVHSGNGWLFTSTKGGWEYPAFLALAALVQALLGAGALALSGDRASATRASLQAA
jgi:putative oxidoreductase